MDYSTKFIEDLVEDVGIKDQNLKQQTVEEIKPVLLDRIITWLLVKLDQKWQDLVVDLIEKQDFEAVFDYFQKNIPNFDKEYEKLLVTFAEEYLKMMMQDVE